MIATISLDPFKLSLIFSHLKKKFLMIQVVYHDKLILNSTWMSHEEIFQAECKLFNKVLHLFLNLIVF